MEDRLQDDQDDLKAEMYSLFSSDGFSSPLPEEYEEVAHTFDKLLERIDEVGKRRSIPALRSFTTIRWAAAVLIIFLSGALFYPFPDRNTTAKVAKSSTERFLARSVSNKGADTMDFVLPDGSMARLFSGSTLIYPEKFEADNRTVQLNGAAYFKAAEDMRRPFSVQANGFTTTALGTSFSIDTRLAGKLEVKLYEGKVVVRSVQKSLYRNIDVYLKPMQSFRANIFDGRFVVGRFDENAAPVVAAGHTLRLPEVRETRLQFNNAPLYEVFDKLNEKFHANIRYARPRVRELHFTGAIFNTDSLKTIITIITRMNGLAFETKDGCTIVH